MILSENVKPLEIISSAQSHGIKLFVNDGRLALKKDKEVTIPPQLLAIVKSHKTEIIDFLEKESYTANNAVSSIQKIEGLDSYPLSHAQLRVWLASQEEESSVGYNMPFSTRLSGDGEHDLLIFEKAIIAVIERHEALRTVFKLNECGEPRQLILSPEDSGFEIKYFDYSQEADPEKSSNSYISTDSFKPFDLANGPLLRASLHKLSEEEHVFYYNVHHIVNDGWSTEVLYRDITAFYRAFKEETTPDISPLSIQYKDFAYWQHEKLNKGEYRDHKDYWVSQFQEEAPSINLPKKRNTPQRKTFNGKRIGSRITQETVSKLRSITSDGGGSLFMGLLTAWKILLYRYSGQSDITIGNPVAGRDHPDLKDQIGFYVNIILLRNYIDPQKSFQEIFKNVKANLLKGYEYQMYPFDKLLEDLNIQRDPSKNPLFDVYVDYHGTAKSGFTFKDGEKIIDLGPDNIKFDLELHLTEFNNNVDLILSYNQDLYERDFIERLIAHFTTLLFKLTDEPNVPVAKVEFLSSEEKQELLETFNGDKIEIPSGKTIVDLFLEQVKLNVDKPAVIFGDKSITYKELNDASNQIADHLINRQDVKSGDLVGIYLDRSADYISAIIGILKAGCAYVPIEPSFPLDRKKYIVQDAGIDLIFSDTTHMFDLGFYEGDLFALDVELDSHMVIDKDVNMATPDCNAYLIYTSGSTGYPKGVIISHDNLYSSIHSRNVYYDRVSSFLLIPSFSFDSSVAVIWECLTTGGKLFVLKAQDLKDFEYLESLVNDNHIESLLCVPSFYSGLLESSSAKLSFRRVILAGEALKMDLVKMHYENNLACQLYNEYGPTENTVWSTCAIINYHDKEVTIGRPISNTSVFILDENMNLVPKGVVGNIFLSGRGLSRGYNNKPDLTFEKFVDHPFRESEKTYSTGDLGCWMPEGVVKFMGRKDHQVKIRGYRIELEEIEVMLNQLLDINQSVVLSIEDENGSNQLVGFVASEKIVDNSLINNFLGSKLPEYMIPPRYVFVEEIPLTPNGKIDRKALIKLNRSFYKDKVHVKPNTEEEILLVDILKSILKKEKISIKDDFYELGGDSIKSINLITKLKNLGYELEIGDIIKKPVLEQMANNIRRAEIIGKPLVSKFVPASLLNGGGDTNDQSAVEFGKAVPLSESQMFFIERPDDIILSHIMTLNNFSESNFEEKIRKFIGFYDSLQVTIEKDPSGIILQRKIPVNEVKLDIKIISDSDVDLKEVHKTSYAYFLRSYNYFDDSALIRLFVVVDPKHKTKAFLRLSIAHVLVDVHTHQHICENLENRLSEPLVHDNTISNFEYSLWQQEFLGSKEGIAQREWWIDFLRKQPLLPKSGLFISQKVNYIVQKKILTGDQFKKLKNIADSLRIPLSGLFLAAHQYFMKNLSPKEFLLQVVAVNGREDNYFNLDISKMLGLVHNSLPIPIREFEDTSFVESVKQVYQDYINVRLNHKIPFEIIREDFYQALNIDISNSIKGFYNFRLKENVEANIGFNDVTVTSRTLNHNDIYDIGLICDLLKNSIEIQFFCLESMYNSFCVDINFNSFIEKIDLNLSDLSRKKAR